MPGLVTHVLFPLLPLLAFTRLPRRLVLVLAPFALVPDLDYFVGVHRATLHNLFVVALPFVLAWLAPRWPRVAPHRTALVLVGTYLGTHVLMDTFVGGVVPFWPLLDTTWVVDVTMDVDTAANRPLLYVDWGTHPGAPVTSRVYAFLTRTDAAVLAGLSAFGLATWLRRRLAVARQP